MGNKLGRNEKCLCKSGKKYKDCCLKKGITFNKPQKHNIQSESSSVNLRSFFQNFNNIDLVVTLSALSINPENHGKNLRLEYLLIEALSANGSSKELLSYSKLKQFLDKNFYHHHLEDPPENLFTENVINYLGNNTLYGGNFSQGAFTLSTLINSINFYQRRFTNEFSKYVNDGISIMLAMSNLIASNAGHSRNMLGDHEKSDKKINFPENLDLLKESIFFPNEWITDFTTRLKIDPNILSHFTIRTQDKFRDKNEIADKDNPLITRPLARLSNGLIVVSPTSIVSALIHFVWTQAINFGCKDELIKTFHDLVWHETRFFMHKVNFENEEFKFHEDPNLPIKNGLLKFDEDKFICLSYIYDEGEEYQLNTPCHNDPMNKMELVQDLQNKNLDAVTYHYTGSNIIDLTLYSTIGREYILMFPQRDDSIHTIITSAFKFLCWVKSESHDKMDLWYFLEARWKFNNSLFSVVPIDFLDYYNLYNSKNKSFYLSDEAKPNGLFIVDGALNVIHSSIQSEDKIVVYHKIPAYDHPVLIPVVKFEGYIPRYFNLENLGKRLEFYLPGYPIDFWIRAKGYDDEVDRKDFSTYWDIAEAISYWFNVIKESLIPHLQQFKYPTLTVSFDIDNIDEFKTLENFGIKDPNIQELFKIRIEQAEISILIPGTIIGYLSGQDNEGERIILRNILLGISQYLDWRELINTLTLESIEGIIDERLPVGLKKMIIIVNTIYSLSLDPRNLVPIRLVQEARSQWYMDEIIPLLGTNCPVEGPISEKKEKLRFGKNIVLSLLTRLREILSNYNSKLLLFELMRNHEAIVHDRTLSNLRTPTRLHCFTEQEDIVKEIQKRANDIDEASLITRCLIEHLAAEHTHGSTVISQQVLDDIMAIMSLIAWWGSLGDRINYDLFETELDVLPSGRIGTNSKEVSEDFFQKFTEARVREYIDDSVDRFSSFFQEEVVKTTNPVPNGFNIAFQGEFGISFDKLGSIVTLLVDIGFEQNSTLAELTVEEVIHNVKESFEVVFTFDEIHAAIGFLSLKDRGKVTNVPSGFENIDISPWRYNRKLSYLQRPLIMINGSNEEKSKIFWTPRHLNHAWHHLNYLFLSGKYKANEDSELQKQMSSISKGRGAVVHQKVVAWFKQNTSCFLDEEVEISPQGKFKSLDNLGDIDVFAIDHNMRIIYSIECKRTEPAKNSKELVEQVEQYLGSGSKPGYFGKHLRRHTWLNDNLQIVGKVYEFNLDGYVLKSFFVTYEILGIQFMRNRPLPMPLVSLFELNNLDYEQLGDKLSKP